MMLVNTAKSKSALLIISSIFAVMLMTQPTSPLAHEPSLHISQDLGQYTSPEEAKFFRSLKMPGSDASCCDDKDCSTVEARFVENRWQAYVFDQWVIIPDYTIVEHAIHPVGSATFCGVINGSFVSTFCFTLPQGAG